MSTFRATFENLRSRTGMYVREPTYASVSALVIGYDLACEGGVLAGFREWLIPRVDTGNNLAWPELVLRVAFPDAVDPREAVRASSVTERHAIDTLFGLVGEFDDLRSKSGLKQIFHDYELWLSRQDWYTEGSPGRNR